MILDVVELIAEAEKRHGNGINLKNVQKLSQEKFRLISSLSSLASPEDP